MSPPAPARSASNRSGSTAPKRTAAPYRDLLFTTKGIEEFVSGVILFDETLRQGTVSANEPFPEYLSRKGIIPGVKVDKGIHDLALSPGEKVTEGLDGLRGRLEEYFRLGARFAKWRAVITIGKGIPSHACLYANAHALARYSALCQEASIVPIVEPRSCSTVATRSSTATTRPRATLSALFAALRAYNVSLEHTVLKASMVVSGKDCPKQAGVDRVAEDTVRCLKRTVPAALPGVVFLSGGQSDEAATAHLNEMARMPGLPWPLTFSYSRALQNAALKTWCGVPGNVAAAQRAFHHRARMNASLRRASTEPSSRSRRPRHGGGALRIEYQESSLAGPGQGPRHVCRGRRPFAHSHHRPALGLRRRSTRPDSGQGPRAERASNFWFKKLGHVVPNHLDGVAPDTVVKGGEEKAQVKGRSVVARKLKPLPIEAVVRGYIIGSGWKDYQKTGAICGIALPKGLKQADKLPEVIFTPATKAEVGAHDENISFAQVEKMIGRELAATVREVSVPPVPRGGRFRPRARHHHRRHEVRVRHRRRRQSRPDRTRRLPRIPRGSGRWTTTDRARARLRSTNNMFAIIWRPWLGTKHRPRRGFRST